MTTFRQIAPNSTVRATNEDYEHFIVWLSAEGGVREWLFSHTDGRDTEAFKSFAIESLSEIRSVPYEDRIEVDCITRSLTREEFDYVKSIFKTNRAYKVLKDGTKIPIAIEPSKVRKQNMIKNFEIGFTFYYQEEDTLNV
jgi:hypothetical protein